MAAACTSIRNGQRRRVIPAKAASAPVSKARSSKLPTQGYAANRPASVSAAVARDMDAIVEKGYVIIGSPDEVANNCAKCDAN